VLLNLERSANRAQYSFDKNRRVKVFAPDNLFDLALNKQRNFAGIIQRQLKNNALHPEACQKAQLLQSHIRFIQQLNTQSQNLAFNVQEIAQDASLVLLFKTPVQYKFKDLYDSVEGFIKTQFGGASQQVMVNMLFHYMVINNRQPLHVALKLSASFENLGMVPVWPPFWHNKETFHYLTFVLLNRHNRGASFDRRCLRPITIKSSEAFVRVVREVCWQLCAWLERYHCRREADVFLTHILRFNDVFQNYITACVAYLDMDPALFATAKKWDWSTILFAQDLTNKFYKYLCREKELHN